MRAAIVLSCVLAVGVAEARDRRGLWIVSAHSHEELRVRPFGRYGIPERHAWARLTRLFRSRRTQERRAVHPRLLRVLAQIQRHFDGGRLAVVSGYRHVGKTSYHGVGHAVDVSIAGVWHRALFEYCRTVTSNLGCGLYPNMPFVHIDVRSRAALWVDIGPPGQGRKYVANPIVWLAANPPAGK